MSDTGKRLQEYAKTLLLATMRDISEDCYCSGWLHSLEYVLWRGMKTGKPFGFGQCDAVEPEPLRQYHEDAGGWWHWPEGADREVFVTTAEWEPIYNASWLANSRHELVDNDRTYML